MKYKKKLSLLLALALGVTPALTLVNQSKSFAEEKILDENKMIEEGAKELELYFSKSCRNEY
ncbi:hypothetical protein [Parvimonas parva]|uniref:hypothetical protein n=1 Tax=Parvimonas parva TaxID=2769485 RepID=UPI0038B37565